MKLTIAFCVLSCSLNSFAGACLKRIEASVVRDAAKALKISPRLIKIRYIGGESMDGDTGGDGEYVSPSQEFFDVFPKNAAPGRSNALGLYLVQVDEVSDEETNEVIDCIRGGLISVPRKDWNGIYKRYL